MSKWEWEFGNLRVTLRIGPVDDSGMGLVVKSRNIPLGMHAGGIDGGFKISVQEASNAEHIEYWPAITMLDQDRRQAINQAVCQALSKAEESNAKEVGIYTMGLEVSRVPSWEVAEEIAKAVYQHSMNDCSVGHVVVVASSPTQMSSFQYAFDNASILI